MHSRKLKYDNLVNYMKILAKLQQQSLEVFFALKLQFVNSETTLE